MLDIKFQFLIHLPHIYGTCMIQSGVDGMSRGEILLDQLQTSVEELMVFYRYSFECTSSILACFSNRIVTPFQFTEPEDWSHNAHQSDNLSFTANTETWVCNLHPCAALDALEYLSQACFKTHGILMGVVVIPNSLRPE